ncbi:MAG: hypothetical protein ACRERC_00865 [Candidatus Binatia bacterium]
MRRPLVCAVALAAVFGAWEIVCADFMADDFMQLAVLERVSPAAAWTSRLDLYNLSDGIPEHVRAMQDAGLFPWFAGTGFALTFFRPLTSAFLWLDHSMFGLHPAGYRLDGVLWSLALAASVGWILCRALPGRTGTLATVIFVLSGIQAVFCWSAARHVVMAAALGFAGLVAHLRWREDGWQPGRALAPLALVLSLAASEVGIAVAVYLLAYEALGRAEGVRRRVWSALPTLIIIGVYLGAWSRFGRGATGGGYIDPLRDPALFLFELPARLAVLLGGVVLGGNADWWLLRPDLRPIIVTIGVAASLGFAVLVVAASRDGIVQQRAAVRWLATATVLSAVPFAGTPIGSRCLLVPFVGGAALLAVVIGRWWTAWRHAAGLRARLLRASAAGLAIIHLVLAPIGRIGGPLLVRQMLAVRVANGLDTVDLDPDTLPQQMAVVLAAPDIVIGLHSAFYRVLHRLPMPATWRVLSWSPGTHRFVRTGVDTLEMDLSSAALADARLRAGSRVSLRGLEATVLSSEHGGQTHVRFRFDRSLDDASVTLLARRDDHLERVAVPQIGETLVIP